MIITDNRDQDFLNAVLEHAGALVVVLDREGRICRFNKACEKLSGFTAAEVLGKFPWDTFLPPEQADNIRTEAFEALADSPEKLAGNYTNHWLAKNGKRYLLDWSNTLLIDDDGRMEYMVSIGTDITERHKNELQLRFQSQIIDQIHDSVVSTDLLGNITSWNKGAERIFGYCADEMLGKPITSVYPGDQIPVLMNDIIAPLKRKGSHEVEVVMQRCNGDRFWAHLALSMLYDTSGKAYGMIGYSMDISERKQVEEDLRIKDAAIESSINAIALAGLDGAISYVNSAFVDLWRLPTAESAIGRSALQFWENPQEAQIVVESLVQQGYWQGELCARRHDGSTAYMQLLANMVKDDNDQPLCMMASFLDISERKGIEAELIEHRANLEALVRQRTSELEVSLAEKEVLLKEVHHRVKNNLAMVNAFIQLQMSQTNDRLTLSALMACDARIRTMAMTHKKLYQSNNLSSIPMQGLFKELCDTVYSPAVHQHIAIEITAGDICLDMDVAIPNAMIINELLSNALKYAFIGKNQGRINITIQKSGDNYYQLEISDNGCGLPKDLNINNTTTLGLQLVNIFVQQLNGTLHVDDRSGTKYTIGFPGRVE